MTMRNEVKFGKLANGLRFYSQYDPSNTSHLAVIGAKCGSIHDPPSASGLFHLIEHNISRECLKYGAREVDRIIERYGGGPNGRNTNIKIHRVGTVYGFNSLFRKKSMFLCFDVVANLLTNKIITGRGIDIEKGAIHNETRLYGDDDIPQLIDDLMHSTMYKINPARKRIDCNIEDLRRITDSKIRRAINRYYVPANMFVVMLGPSHDEVRRITNEYFGSWPNRQVPKLSYDHSEDYAPLAEMKSARVVRDIHQYHYGIGFPTEAYNSKDAEALDVLSRIWAWRLRDRLRENNCDFDKGVYRVLGFTERSFVHGIIYAWYASVDRKFADAGEQIVIEEADRLKKDLASRDEVEDIVHNMYEENYLDAFRNTPDILCDMIVDAVCNGDEKLKMMHGFGSRIRKVSPRKLREVANKYFTPSYVKVVVGPKD